MSTQREQILNLLREKSVMKQDVYKNTQQVFALFRKVIEDIVNDLKDEVAKIDKRVSIDFKITSDFEIELKVAGDMLVFYMHSNVFEFDRSHSMFKTGYIKQNELNSYCGIIYIYNFLADSFKYNRLGDIGYLIGRVFINRESRFFAEGKPNLSIKYPNFSEQAISETQIKDIIYELVMHALNFDLFTPPAEAVREISLNEIVEKVQYDKLKTGKRLGFKMAAEGNIGEDVLGL